MTRRNTQRLEAPASGIACDDFRPAPKSRSPREGRIATAGGGEEEEGGGTGAVASARDVSARFGAKRWSIPRTGSPPWFFNASSRDTPGGTGQDANSWTWNRLRKPGEWLPDRDREPGSRAFAFGPARLGFAGSTPPGWPVGSRSPSGMTDRLAGSGVCSRSRSGCSAAGSNWAGGTTISSPGRSASGAATRWRFAIQSAAACFGVP
ncbi:hypothetical protein SAMN05444166_2596 [Singulisphaera sp. GP187]|nr:hypothetical protein SAMN05444166_2596 [Singulisphaera sp. GP187]